MICKKIEYKNFRNIENAVFIPSESVTVLNGQNGQGKTNFLEGIYLFAGVRSFRTAKENELVRFGCDFAEIKMLFNNGRRDINMTLRFVSENNKRYCNINGVPITKLSETVGNFRAVLFCPQHLSIVKDGPLMRRRFLDSAISQVNSNYLRSLQKYSSILAQRNATIKMARDRHDDSIFLNTNEIWAEQLAKEAEYISEKRNEYTEKLSFLVNEIISDMTGGRESTEISYQQPKNYEEYYKLFTENQLRELKAGITLYGIQKDDLKIELLSHDARAYASQGQQRSIALAMKIAEGELSREYGGEYPVFLFDDILSELDENRKEFLLRGISDKQVIITSCENICETCFSYTVKNGEIISAIK